MKIYYPERSIIVLSSSYAVGNNRLDISLNTTSDSPDNCDVIINREDIQYGSL